MSFLLKLFMVDQSIDIPKKMLELGNTTPVAVTESFDFKQKKKHKIEDELLSGKKSSCRQSQLSLTPIGQSGLLVGIFLKNW